MPDLAWNYNSDVSTYLNGSTAIDEFLRVFDIGGTVRVAAADELENGISVKRALPNTSIAVLPLQNNQRVTLVANGAIAMDGDVFAAAGGKVSGSGTRRMGKAKTASAVDGDHLEVFIEIAGTGGGGGGGYEEVSMKDARLGVTVGTENTTAPDSFMSFVATNQNVYIAYQGVYQLFRAEVSGTDAEETSIGSSGEAETGQIFNNTQSGNVKYWTGAAWANVATL